LSSFSLIQLIQGKSGSLGPAPYRRHRFAQRYTRADIELLAIQTTGRSSTRGTLSSAWIQSMIVETMGVAHRRVKTLAVVEKSTCPVAISSIRPDQQAEHNRCPVAAGARL